MAFLTFVLGPALIALLGAAIIGLILWLVFLVVAGLVEGLILSNMGKRFVNSEVALAGHQKFGKGCKIVGRISTVVSVAIIVSVIAAWILPTSGGAGPSALSTIGAYLVILASALLLLETPLLVANGILLIGVFRRNRKLATPTIGKLLAVFCLVLGIATLLVCGASLLTFGGILLLAG